MNPAHPAMIYLLSLGDLVGLILAALAVFIGGRAIFLYLLRKRIRSRRHRPVVALILLALGAGWLIYAIPQFDWPFRVSVLKPVWYLKSQFLTGTTSDDRTAAMAELTERDKHKRLTDNDRSSINLRCLQLQRDVNQDWDPIWGDWIKYTCHGRYDEKSNVFLTLDDGAKETFARAAGTLALHVSPEPLHVGEYLTVGVKLDPPYRMDQHESLVGYALLVESLDVDGNSEGLKSPVVLLAHPDAADTRQSNTSDTKFPQIAIRCGNLTVGRHVLTARVRVRANFQGYGSAWTSVPASPSPHRFNPGFANAIRITRPRISTAPTPHAASVAAAPPLPRAVEYRMTLKAQFEVVPGAGTTNALVGVTTQALETSLQLLRTHQ